MIDRSIRYGTQRWSTSNLNVTHFRNGDEIPEITTKEDWYQAYLDKQPAWCFFDNDEIIGEEYGRLYNWHAVTDERGLAPEGWHIPSDDEWTLLIHHLSSQQFGSGRNMKSIELWKPSVNSGTNQSGFDIKPSGYRNFYGDFFFLGLHAYFWSTTEHYNNLAWYRTTDYLLKDILRYYNVKGNGFPCRCVKDLL